MIIHTAFTPILSLVAGIAILLIPQLLSIIVALYLIVVGVAGLLPLYKA